MKRKAALLVGTITHAKNEWQALSHILELKEYNAGSRADFIQKCDSGMYDDVVAIYRSNASTSITGRFDHELLVHLPRSVRFICHNGAGYDNIDVEGCTERGILISNTPVAVDNATADIAIFLMIGALRQAQKPISGIRSGKWRGAFTLGHDPNRKILGILGMGGIGREVAKRALAFGMTIQYHNRTRLSPVLEQGATYVSFSELISTSDVISLNCSLTEQTRHIIGAAEFAAMKEGVVLVNTARGALIDERALVEALDCGKVYSAGLDVFEAEPCVEPGLLENPNVMLLPHIGTATYETQKEMEVLVLRNLECAVTEGRLVTLIGEQKDMALDGGKR